MSSKLSEDTLGRLSAEREAVEDANWHKNPYATLDYWFICDIDTPKAEREKLHIGDIYENAAVCKKCDDYIRSRNRHDFRTCSCGSIFVDGGSHYTRRGGDFNMMIECVTMFNDVGN